MPTASTFGYVPPYLNWSRKGSVSGATSSDEHSLDWLVDDRGLFPLHVDGNSASLTVTNSSHTVSVVAIHNHRIDGDIAVSGGIAGTLTAAAAQADGIFLNPFLRVTPAAITSLSISISGNDEDVVIGELIAGELIEMPMPMWSTEEFTDEDYSDESYPGSLIGITPYPEDAEARTWRGTQLYTTEQRDLLLQCRKAQRGYAIPTLIIPDLSVNDAWYGYIRKFKSKPRENWWEIELVITECPRTRF